MLSPVEQEEVRTRARGLSDDEIKIFLKEIPSIYLHKELFDRDMASERKLMAHAQIASLDFRDKSLKLQYSEYSEEVKRLE